MLSLVPNESYWSPLRDFVLKSLKDPHYTVHLYAKCKEADNYNSLLRVWKSSLSTFQGRPISHDIDDWRTHIVLSGCYILPPGWVNTKENT